MLVKFPSVPELGWAAPYIGTPWLWQGGDPSGFDCAGWLLFAWTRYWGLSLPDWQEMQTGGDDYARERQARALIDHYLRDCVKIQERVPGAGVLMTRGSVPAHVGIYERGGDVIHACETAGQLVREPVADLETRILGYYVPQQAVSP